MCTCWWGDLSLSRTNTCWLCCCSVQRKKFVSLWTTSTTRSWQAEASVGWCLWVPRCGGRRGLVWAATKVSARDGTLFPSCQWDADLVPPQEECEGNGLFAYVRGTWRSCDCATQMWGGEIRKGKKRSYNIVCVNCEFALPQSIVSRVFVRCLSYTTRGFLSFPMLLSHLC